VPAAPVLVMTDWVGDWRKLAAVWGLPAAAMVAAAYADPLTRTVVWTVALVWMGGACLANAWRCNRTHCRYTGPFFLVMAALVVADAAGALPLGLHGWAILGGTVAVGNAIIWGVSKRIFGRYWVEWPVDAYIRGTKPPIS
jgi:hypothetical protein